MPNLSQVRKNGYTLLKLHTFISGFEFGMLIRFICIFDSVSAINNGENYVTIFVINIEKVTE